MKTVFEHLIANLKPLSKCYSIEDIHGNVITIDEIIFLNRRKMFMICDEKSYTPKQRSKESFLCSQFLLGFGHQSHCFLLVITHFTKLWRNSFIVKLNFSQTFLLDKTSFFERTTNGKMFSLLLLTVLLTFQVMIAFDGNSGNTKKYSKSDMNALGVHVKLYLTAKKNSHHVFE